MNAQTALGARIALVLLTLALMPRGALGDSVAEPTMASRGVISWTSLPFDHAIRVARGSGRRKIAVFADPNCDYCQKFEAELAKIDDIAVYLFLYPVVRSQSRHQVKAIWCSKDPAKAWHDLLFRRIGPVQGAPCKDPVDKIITFAKGLGIDATPTWFLENGDRHAGLKSHAELLRLMEAASPSRR